MTTPTPADDDAGRRGPQTAGRARDRDVGSRRLGRCHRLQPAGDHRRVRRRARRGRRPSDVADGRDGPWHGHPDRDRHPPRNAAALRSGRRAVQPRTRCVVGFDLARRGARAAARHLPDAADVPLAGPDAGPRRDDGRSGPPAPADPRCCRSRLRPRLAGRAGEAAPTGDARPRVPDRRHVRRLGHRVRHAATHSDRQPGTHPHPTRGHVLAGCGVDHRHRRAGGRADGVGRQPPRQRPRAAAPPRLRHPRRQCPVRPVGGGARRQPRQPARLVGAMARRRRVRRRHLLAPVGAGAFPALDAGHHARRVRRPGGRCRRVRRSAERILRRPGDDAVGAVGGVAEERATEARHVPSRVLAPRAGRRRAHRRDRASRRQPAAGGRGDRRHDGHRDVDRPRGADRHGRLSHDRLRAARPHTVRAELPPNAGWGAATRSIHTVENQDDGLGS